MPATLYYSHKILEKLAADRHSGAAPFLEPDAKSQVTLEYQNEKPVRATALVVSTQHAPGYCEKGENADPAKYKVLHDYVMAAFREILPDGFITDDTNIYINPTGQFEIGGPDGDAGLTGRKIIVDTYGGAAPHGGGAFSGKDPTKVDRSAAYVARYLAKNIVAAGLARRVTIQLSYAIGIAEPLSVYVDTHGTGTVDESVLEAVLPKLVRLTPKGHPRASEAQRPDLPEDRGLWSFRARSRGRPVHVGKDRSGRRAEGGGRLADRHGLRERPVRAVVDGR